MPLIKAVYVGVCSPGVVWFASEAIRCHDHSQRVDVHFCDGAIFRRRENLICMNYMLFFKHAIFDYLSIPQCIYLLKWTMNLALESSIEIREKSSNKINYDHAWEALASIIGFCIEIFHVVTGKHHKCTPTFNPRTNTLHISTPERNSTRINADGHSLR